MPDAMTQQLEATFQALSPTDDARTEYSVDQGHRVARYEVRSRSIPSDVRAPLMPYPTFNDATRHDTRR